MNSTNPALSPPMRPSSAEARSAPGTWQTQAPSTRQRAASFWCNLLFWSARWTPWITKTTVQFWVWCSWICSPAIRAGTLANARRLLGPASTLAERRRHARRVIRNFMMFVYDIGVRSAMTQQEIHACITAVEGEEHYEAARRIGRGVIIATAHMGSFEVGTSALRDREPRIHVVFQPDRLKAFNHIRSGLRRKLGVIDAPIEDGLQTWATLRDALLRNEAVLIQADRVMPGQRGAVVPFFDGHAELPLGPVKLAKLTGAPILPVFSLVEPDRSVRIVIEAPIMMDEDDAALGHGAPRALLQLAATLEKNIRRSPDQWLILYRAWLEDRTQA